MANIPMTAAVLGLAWLIFRIISYYNFVSKLRGVPLKTYLIGPISLIGSVMYRTIPFVVKGRNNGFENKWHAYESAGWNLFATVAPIPNNQSVVWVADKNIIKDLTAQRAKFPKPVQDYFLLTLYGESVLATEGEEWKRHKKISQPAFSEQNNRLVWSAVDGIVSELCEDVWAGKDEVVVKDMLDLCTRFTLMVLGIAAFGKDMRWKTNSEVPPGHSMDFAQAIYLVSSNIIPIYVMPRWTMGLTRHLRKIRTAAAELVAYTSEMIEEKEKSFESGKKPDITGKWDLLTNLVAASEDEGNEAGGVRLSKSELRGNIFIFLLAGHETIAHTLTYCFNLLALYPEEQEKLREHIHDIIGEGHAKYDDYRRLTRVQAVINESLPLFPPVSAIPKITTEDTTFNVSIADPVSETTRQVVIPSNTRVIIHTPGLHFNPRYWPDPYAFKPERFLGDYDKDAFLPFSGSARACAGRKFAEVELAGALTFLIPRYKICLSSEKEVELAGLTVKEKMEKLLKSDDKLTLTGVPVRTFLICPASFVGNLLDKSIPFIIRGRNSGFVEKFQTYESVGWNIFASVSPYPGNQAIFWVADKNIIKDIAAQRTRFPKPVKDYYLMRLYGESVLVTEGEEWKRHKRISQPAFSEQNNKLVWSAVDGIMSELFEEVWGEKDEVVVKDTLDLGTRASHYPLLFYIPFGGGLSHTDEPPSIQFAVMVLGIAAFGKEMRWATNAEVPPGHSMDFPQSIYLVSSNIIATYAMPRWAMGITQKLRKVRTAAAELVGYTSDMIEDIEKGSGSEKTSGIAGKSDLFTNLVAASEDEGHEVGSKRLSKSELRGNIFIFLIAGHETTAHTLAFCLGLLVLYPGERQKLFDHINDVVRDNHAKYEDFPRLTRVQAVINESLRLFSPVSSIPKFTTEDSVFTVSAADPKSDATTQMVIPAGRHIILHTPGLHYNPRYWPDPYDFKPDRFLRNWDRDSFIPFSIGARACAGKKFAEVELTAALTFLIPRYTIHLTAEKEAELTRMTVKEKIQKLLETEMRLTLTPPTDLELVFKRR